MNVVYLRTCDNCGQPVADPDEVLCATCKPKPRGNSVSYILGFYDPKLKDYAPNPVFGIHPTNVAAKRAYVIALVRLDHPGVTDNYTDDQVRYHFGRCSKSYALDVPLVKVLKYAP